MKLFVVASCVFAVWYLLGKVPQIAHQTVFNLPSAGFSLSLGVLICIGVAWIVHNRVR